MPDDKIDNFALMADKIQLRNTDKDFVMQPNDEATKLFLKGDS